MPHRFRATNTGLIQPVANSWLVILVGGLRGDDFFRPCRDSFRCFPQPTVRNGGLFSVVPAGLQETVLSALKHGWQPIGE